MRGDNMNSAVAGKGSRDGVDATGVMAIARRYPRPSTDSQAAGGGSLPTAEEINAFGAWLGPPGWWTLPRVLAILGLLSAPFLAPLGFILGLVGHYKAKKRRESTRLPMAAWIASIILAVMSTVINFWVHSLFNYSVY